MKKEISIKDYLLLQALVSPSAKSVAPQQIAGHAKEVADEILKINGVEVEKERKGNEIQV